MNNEIAKKGWEFWGIVGFMVANLAILVTIVGFMLSMNARMATKADIARVEANIATKADKSDVARVESDIARVESDIKEIRTLFIGHIGDSHKHKKRDRQPASEQKKSKSK